MVYHLNSLYILYFIITQRRLNSTVTPPPPHTHPKAFGPFGPKFHLLWRQNSWCIRRWALVCFAPIPNYVLGLMYSLFYHHSDAVEFYINPSPSPHTPKSIWALLTQNSIYSGDKTLDVYGAGHWYVLRLMYVWTIIVGRSANVAERNDT